MERTERKNLEDELKKAKEEHLTANAKKKVEKRKLEHGVLSKPPRNFSLDPKKESHEQ